MKIISKTSKIDPTAIIEENVEITGNSTIGANSIIRSGCKINDSQISENCDVNCSIISNSIIGNNCKIGPYAHLRPNTKLADNVKVGSFVEIKNSTIGFGSKVPHLSYVGDADIGKNVNVGCGVIFANYNGKIKQHSTIGDNVFIGCNVNIVAPVTIADNTYICAGTTVTNDTEINDFVIGRSRQENKKGKLTYYNKK